MWLALFLISMTWLFSIRIYAFENYLAVIILTVLAIISAAVSLFKAHLDFTSFNRKYYILLIPLAISWLILPFPYNMGIALLFIGLAIIPLCSRWRWLPALSVSLLFNGAILVFQSLNPRIYAVFVSSYQQFDILTPVVYRIMQFLGLSVSYSQDILFVRMMRELHAFSTTWVKMGILPFLNLMVGGALAFWLLSGHKQLRKKILSLCYLFILGIVYVLVRYVFMILIFVCTTYFVGYYEDVSMVHIFWRPTSILLSFLLFPLLISKVVPLRLDAEDIGEKFAQPIRKRHVLATAILCIGVFLIVSSIGFHDPGKEKGGRLLMDEKHSDWEISTRKYDTEWYGPLSGYNYYCMAEYLNHYYRLERNFDEITPELLSKYDVLILKIPTSPFNEELLLSLDLGLESHLTSGKVSEDLRQGFEKNGIALSQNATVSVKEREWLIDDKDSKRMYSVRKGKDKLNIYNNEVEAIVEFVKNGGGLLLLGEHTNVFGSSAFLNPISNRFNFSFRYDVVFDIETKFVQLYTPPKFLPHPIAQNMPPFRFETSCSMEPYSCFVERVILGNGLKSLDIDYHSSNFYPQVIDAAHMRFGPFIQMIAVKHRKGRVAAFTDSTVFSNFSAFHPGKPELLLGSVEWLNRTNHLRWLNFLFFFIGIASLPAAVITLRKGSLRDRLLSKQDPNRQINLRFISLNIVLGICVTAIAISLFTAVTRESYPLPKLRTPLVQIHFEQEHCDYQFPLVGHVEDYSKSYEIFHQWILRVGYYPFIGKDLDDCMERGDAIVIINPKKDFTQEEAAAVKEYVSQGGKILLMDNPSNVGSSANSLLQAFGMEIDRGRQIKPSIAYDSSGRNSWTIGNIDANPIKGGKAILFTQAGEAILSMAKSGEGRVIAMTFSDRFADSKMGGVERTVPNEALLSIFHLEFALFRGIVNDNLEDELSKPFK